MHDRPAGRQPDSSFWNELDKTEQDTLRQAGRLQRFPVGGVPLCFEGDGTDNVLIILAGWAKVTSPTSSGREVVLAVRGPGDIVGELSGLFGRPRSATVQAVVDIETLSIAASRFREFLDGNPRCWWPLTATLVARMDDLGDRLRVHAENDGGRRIAHLLVYLAELFIRDRIWDPGDPIEVHPPLSQTELGSWVDISRETAARAFRVLRARGLVQTGWRRIIVLDLAGLRAYAEGSPLS